jgi:hypothetical protein
MLSSSLVENTEKIFAFFPQLLGRNFDFCGLILKWMPFWILFGFFVLIEKSLFQCMHAFYARTWS